MRKQLDYLFSPGLFQSLTREFKAFGVSFSSDPTGPVGMMYARTGMPTMNTLNHQRLVQIGLMRTIWTTVSQMNGIPFHTRLRTLIFRSLYFANRQPPPLLIPSICAASSETLILLWFDCGYGSNCKRSFKCPSNRRGGIGILPWLHSDSRLDAGTKVSNLPGDSALCQEAMRMVPIFEPY